jgi:hypothetical protein
MRAHLTRTLDALTKARVFETTNGASEAEEGEPAATARRTRRRSA